MLGLVCSSRRRARSTSWTAKRSTNGWLFTLGYGRIEKAALLDGSDPESDPLDRRQIDDAAVLTRTTA